MLLRPFNYRDRPECLVDPLSDVLSLLRPRSYVSAGFDAGGAWSVRWPEIDGIKCYAVASGRCWLEVAGVADPIYLQTGDCFLLPGGRSFRLASDLQVPPVDAAAVYGARRDGTPVTCNGGGSLFLVGSYFALDGRQAGALLKMLPPVVHFRQEADKAALRWCVERMTQEAHERQPGSTLMSQHLAHMMLVQALRLYLAEGQRRGGGWLFALADKKVGAAISAIHGDPARGWTVEALAKQAGLSRSTFALRFKAGVGEAPLGYLTRWRMMLAGDRLLNTREPVAGIALSLGYKSEAAFSTAFKRVVGFSPRQYGRGAKSAAPGTADHDVNVIR